MNIHIKSAQVLDPHKCLDEKAIILCFDKKDQGRFFLTDLTKDNVICGMRGDVVIDMTGGDNFQEPEIFIPMICVGPNFREKLKKEKGDSV